jgi:septal ring factor EnvC (AmiA/AmiB activator)
LISLYRNISKQLSALASEVGRLTKIEQPYTDSVALSAALADKNKELAQIGALLTDREAEIEESVQMLAVMTGELKIMKSQNNDQASREEK